MTFSIPALAAEITGDPAALGYVGKSAPEIAALLSAPTRSRPLASVSRGSVKWIVIAAGAAPALLASTNSAARTVQVLWTDPDYETITNLSAFEALIDAVVSQGDLPAQVATAIKAACNETCSRCQELWGIGSVDWHEVVQAQGKIVLGVAEKVWFAAMDALGGVGLDPLKLDFAVLQQMEASRLIVADWGDAITNDIANILFSHGVFPDPAGKIPAEAANAIVGPLPSQLTQLQADLVAGLPAPNYRLTEAGAAFYNRVKASGGIYDGPL